MDLTGKPFEASDRKINKKKSRPCRKKFNARILTATDYLAPVNSKNQTKQNLKKAFLQELLELCKIKSRKSKPHIFQFL